MLEAVTSVLQTAPVARGNAEQASNARSFAANPDKVQEVPRAPYISPYIHMDVNYDKAVLQIRDSETGDVIRQFPSETRLRLQSAQQASSEETTPAPQQESQAPAPQQSAESTAQFAQTQSVAPQQGGEAQEPAPQQSAAPAPSGNAATAQQLAAFKTASTTASAGNGGQVSLFA